MLIHELRVLTETAMTLTSLQVNPLLRSGSRGCITDVSSLYALPKSISVEELSSKLKAQLIGNPFASLSTSSGDSGAEFSQRQERDDANDDNDVTITRVSLGRALFNTFGAV